jgi:hypothetical protein
MLYPIELRARRGDFRIESGCAHLAQRLPAFFDQGFMSAAIQCAAAIPGVG